jgi:hypothetical protein
MLFSDLSGLWSRLLWRLLVLWLWVLRLHLSELWSRLLVLWLWMLRRLLVLWL